MGYTFTIGNALPKFDKTDFPYLSAKWEVDGAVNAEAPAFPNDGMTGRTSQRSPSYSAWADFTRAVGLRDFFYDEMGHLRAGHPGCIGLTTEDADFITAALARYQAQAVFPPGFEGWDHVGPQQYDPHLARLIWLEWWVRWAVENCETPAIENI